MADWMPKSARPYRPASAQPDVSGVESFARGAYQGAGMGFADEQAGALDALGGHLRRTFTNDWKRTGGGWWDDIKAEAGQVVDDYRKGRDESRQAYAEAEEANPTAYGVGQFGGAVGTGLLTGGASALGREGIKGALTAGALEGAAGGLGGSNADLTHADLDAYAKAFRDSTEGGITGTALAGGIYGVGKGLKWVGGKAVGALRGARGELEAGISAEREAADELARAAEDKAAGRLVKDEYNARQMNARMDERAAREEAKRAAKEAREAARAARVQGRQPRAPEAPAMPVEDPNTAVLGGYRGKAGERRAVNYDRVRQYRQDIADPNFTGDRGRLEQYAREYGDAVDNPGAFERRMVERYLRENYPPEVAERVLRERVGPNGEILPRGSGTEPSTDVANIGEIAEAMGENPRYLRQRDSGLGAQDLGAGRFGDETFAYPNADIRRSQVPSGDPLHDAKTEFGLSYMGKTADEPGLIGGVDEYRFIDPKTGRDYQIEAFSDPRSPSNLSLEYVGPNGVPADQAMGAAYSAEKNQVGPGTMRKVFRDLRERYPEAQRVTSERITGGNGNRDIDMALPAQRTPVVAAQPESAPASVSPNPPLRNEDPFHDAPTKVGLVEVTPERSAEYMTSTDEPWRYFVFKDPASGRDVRVTAHVDAYDSSLIYIEDVGFNDLPKGMTHQQAWGDASNKVGSKTLRHVLTDLARAFPGRTRIGGHRVTGISPNRPMSVGLPEVTQRMDLGDAIRQGRGDVARMGGGGSAWQDFGPDGRTISDFIPDREPPVSGDDLRQWLDMTQEARGGAPEGLPPLEDITSPGAPSFPSDVRRAQPFQAPPQLRPEYQPQPAAPRPVFDEALAERRAMGANAQAGAGGMPTRNLGPARPPPAFDPSNSMVSPRDFDAETVVPLGDTQVPRAPRPSPYAGPVAPELGAEPVLANPLRQARPRPLAPPVAPPSQTTMGAPPGSLVRQARQSVGELVAQREQDALGDVVSAGWKGARSANNALAAPFGALYGIGKEAMQNPAVRARAITAFRLDRLARVRPEVWARVGPILQRAFQSGPERYKAERHVLLLRDPEFRAAEAEADAELEAADGDVPRRRAMGR